MAASAEYLEFLKEQMAGFGEVSTRRMFGGTGIFHNGAMIALVVRDTLFFKADDMGRKDFEAENLPQFTYGTKNGQRSLGYWRAPERCFDDPDEMTVWCRKAYDAMLRASPPKRKRQA